MGRPNYECVTNDQKSVKFLPTWQNVVHAGKCLANVANFVAKILPMFANALSSDFGAV